MILHRRIPAVGAVGYIAYGPVIAVNTPVREETRSVLVRAFADLARSPLRMLFIQPAEGTDDVRDELLRRGFRPSEVEVAPAGSVRVDLQPSQEELRLSLRDQRLRKLARTNKWEAKGVRVRIGDAHDLPAFAELHACTAANQGFEAFSLDYIRSLYAALAPDHVSLFLGEIDGVPVAGHLYTRCGYALKFRLTGFDRTRDTAGVGIPGVLHWEALCWAKQNQYRWLDMGGVQPSLLRLMSGGGDGAKDIPSHVWFKMRFGGRPHLYPPPVELISSPVVRVAYDVVRHASIGRRLISGSLRALRSGRTPPRSDRVGASA
ncbi:lipid II:glycine glycyltransferase FemX [Saccharopolyspora sp. NPDC002376]